MLSPWVNLGLCTDNFFLTNENPLLNGLFTISLLASRDVYQLSSDFFMSMVFLIIV